jgi:uncharacterized protein with PQ loop repeat
MERTPHPNANTETMITSLTSQLALIAAVYGVISSLSPMLQIVRMRRAGSADSLSRSYVMIGAGGYLIWFAYGLSLGNMPLIVCDAIGAVMQLTVLWWAYRLDAPADGVTAA